MEQINVLQKNIERNIHKDSSSTHFVLLFLFISIVLLIFVYIYHILTDKPEPPPPLPATEEEEEEVEGRREEPEEAPISIEYKKNISENPYLTKYGGALPTENPLIYHHTLPGHDLLPFPSLRYPYYHGFHGYHRYLTPAEIRAYVQAQNRRIYDVNREIAEINNEPIISPGRYRRMEELKAIREMERRYANSLV